MELAQYVAYSDDESEKYLWHAFMGHQMWSRWPGTACDDKFVNNQDLAKRFVRWVHYGQAYIDSFSAMIAYNDITCVKIGSHVLTYIASHMLSSLYDPLWDLL